MWNSTGVTVHLLINFESEHVIFLIAYSLCIWCRALGVTPREPGSSKQPGVMLANHKKQAHDPFSGFHFALNSLKLFPFLALDGGLTDWVISHSDRSFGQVRTMPVKLVAENRET